MVMIGGCGSGGCGSSDGSDSGVGARYGVCCSGSGGGGGRG